MRLRLKMLTKAEQINNKRVDKRKWLPLVIKRKGKMQMNEIGKVNCIIFLSSLKIK